MDHCFRHAQVSMHYYPQQHPYHPLNRLRRLQEQYEQGESSDASKPLGRAKSGMGSRRRSQATTNPASTTPEEIYAVAAALADEGVVLVDNGTHCPPHHQLHTNASGWLLDEVMRRRQLFEWSDLHPRKLFEKVGTKGDT